MNVISLIWATQGKYGNKSSSNLSLIAHLSENSAGALLKYDNYVFLCVYVRGNMDVFHSISPPKIKTILFNFPSNLRLLFETWIARPRS